MYWIKVGIIGEFRLLWDWKPSSCWYWSVGNCTLRLFFLAFQSRSPQGPACRNAQSSSIEKFDLPIRTHINISVKKKYIFFSFWRVPTIREGNTLFFLFSSNFFASIRVGFFSLPNKLKRRKSNLTKRLL